MMSYVMPRWDGANRCRLALLELVERDARFEECADASR